MWCHLLLFGFPVVGLALFALLPWPLALALYGIGSAVSIGAGAVTLAALRRPPSTGAEGMAGRVARVEAVEGRRVVVRVDNELWNAVMTAPVAPGDPVVIVSVEGLTVRTRPLAASAEHGETRTRSGSERC